MTKNPKLPLLIVFGTLVIALLFVFMSSNKSNLGQSKNSILKQKQVAAACISAPCGMHLSGKDFMNDFITTSNAVIIDVRTPEEYAAGHIEKAINIDVDSPSFINNIKELDPTQVYFIYCRSGHRSGIAFTTMIENGINNVNDLQGGIISNQDSIKLVK